MWLSQTVAVFGAAPTKPALASRQYAQRQKARRGRRTSFRTGGLRSTRPITLSPPLAVLLRRFGFERIEQPLHEGCRFVVTGVGAERLFESEHPSDACDHE